VVVYPFLGCVTSCLIKMLVRFNRSEHSRAGIGAALCLSWRGQIGRSVEGVEGRGLRRYLAKFHDIDTQVLQIFKGEPLGSQTTTSERVRIDNFILMK
jgi:hypothetical protein